MRKSKKNSKQPEQIRTSNQAPAKIEPLRPKAEQLDKLYNDLAKFPSENPYPIMRIHKDGTVLYANKASEPLLKARDSGIGRTAPREWHQLVKKALSSGQVIREETEHDGRVFALRAVPISDNNYVNFYGADITEQKRAEEALKKSEEKFRNIFENSNVGISVTSLDGTLNANTVFCDMLGYSKEELSRVKWTDITLQEDTTLSNNYLGQLRSGKEKSVRFQKRYVKKDGSIIFADASVTLQKDKDGKPPYYITTIMDITERKKAGEALQTSEKRFRSLYQSVQAGVMVRAADGTITHVNDVACKILEMEAQDIISRGLEDEKWQMTMERGEFVPLKEYPAMITMRTGKPIRNAVRSFFSGNAAKKKWLLLNTEPIFAPGQKKPHEVIITFQDITELKQAQESLRTSEAKLSNAMKIAKLGYWEYDAVKDLFTFNDHFYNIFHTTAERVGGYTMPSARYVELFVHPDDRKTVGIEIQKALETTDPNYSNQLEHRILYANGGIGHITVRYFVIKDSQGRTIKTYGANQDVTERKKAEESLLASELRYRRLFETARDGILILDADSGMIVDVNPFIENILGYPHKRFLNKHLWEIGFFKDIEASKDAFLELQTKGYIRYENLPLKTKDGRQIAVEFVSNVYMVDHKKVIQCNIRDITERALVEEALQISETRFRELFNNMSSGVTVYEAVDDGKDFIIKDFNGAAEKIEKVSKESIIGKRVTEVFPGVKEMGLLDVFRRVWKTGKSEQSPMTLYKDNRISGWRENYVYKLPCGELVAVYDDVTERKLAEEQLEQERNLLRTLIDHIPDDVYVKDKDSRFIISNKAVTEYWNSQGKSNIIGKTDFDLFSPAEAQQYFAEEQIIIQTGKPIINREGQFILKNGEIHRCLTTKLPLQDNLGNIVGIIGINRDITERKLTEEKLLGYQKQLKRLAAQLALTEERERRRIAGELHDHVNQSLALAKIKLDSLQAALSSQPMAGVIEDISGSIEKAIQDTRTLTFDLSNPILYELGFEAAVSEWLDENVRGKHKINTEFQDDGRDKPLDDDMRALLFRNVRELLINTIKYSSADKVKVSVRRIDDSIEVVVEDNGVGFDPVEVRTLASKRAEFGLLSIRESLEELGGHFEIESKPGAGCKATMTAPLKSQSRKKED